MHIVTLIIGICAGFLGGLVGIGGGIIMIPALVFFMNFNQHTAQGTSLAAMLPPIGLLAAWEYYKNGQVNIPAALLIAGGFLLGSLAGAKLAVFVDDSMMKKIFGSLLLLVSIKMIFFE